MNPRMNASRQGMARPVRIRAQGGLAWLAACLLIGGAPLVTGSAEAADAARGAQLYLRTDAGNRSCVACHGPDPGQNHNNILRAADAPVTLTRVLNTVSAMGFLRSELSDSDRADISAFLGSIARLNVPHASLRIWPVTADFGATLVGGESAIQTVRLLNPSRTAAVPLGSLTVSSARIELSHNCPATLLAAAACDVQMRFKPQATGLIRAALRVESPALSVPVYAGVIGSGAAGNLSQLTWDGASELLRFEPGATTAPLRRTLTLQNPGPMPATLGLTSVVGPDAARFRIESGCAGGSVLQAGTRCEISLVYTPSLLPLVQASLQLRSDQGNPPSIRLEGSASQMPPPAPPVEQLLTGGGSGGGCSMGPPSQRVFDPVLALAALLAASALGRRRRR